MANIQYSAKDGTGATKPVLAQDNGDGSFTFYHVEDTTQRAALISALNSLSTASGQSAMSNAIVSAVNATTAATQPVSISARVLVDTVVQAVSTSRSGTITTGGTAQQLMAANGSRRGFVLQNNSTGPLYVNGLGTATSDGLSLTIAAGALYESNVQHTGTGAISILGATTGQAFYSREF